MSDPRLPASDPTDAARAKALRLLGVRARSSQELHQRLRAHGFSEEIARAVLERLRETGLLDDRRFALDRAQSMGRGKGWGPRKLRADLIQRGIDKEVAEEAVAQAYGKHPPAEIMRRLISKRFGEEVLSGGGDPKVRAKAQRFLLGKGFEPDEVFGLFTAG